MKTNTLHCKTGWERQAWGVSVSLCHAEEDTILKDCTCVRCSADSGVNDCLILLCNDSSGTAGSCVMAGWLQFELQWAEGGEWTLNQAQTAVSGRNARLLRHKSLFYFCWQVSSSACRLVMDPLPLTRSWQFFSDKLFFEPFFSASSAELKQAQTMMNALQWREVILEVHQEIHLRAPRKFHKCHAYIVLYKFFV